MAQKITKPFAAWGCKWSSGEILPDSIRRTRKEVIALMEKEFDTTWETLRKNGHCAIKLRIQEVLKSARKPKDPTQPFPQLNLFDE